MPPRVPPVFIMPMQDPANGPETSRRATKCPEKAMPTAPIAKDTNVTERATLHFAKPAKIRKRTHKPTPINKQKQNKK